LVPPEAPRKRCHLQHRPGCFLRLGNGEDSPMLRNAAYDFNDANLTVGAAYWTSLVQRFLAPAGD
jgi:hippurate hydrolase